MTNPLLISMTAGLLAQFIKMILFIIDKKKFSFRPFVMTGGMPSSHTSTVVALCTSIGFVEGFNSSFFHISVVFSLIIMYDAAGLRRAVGRQAIILNRILEDIELQRRVKEKRIRELLGHTPLEVIMGALLGIVWALYWYYINGG